MKLKIKSLTVILVVISFIGNSQNTSNNKLHMIDKNDFETKINGKEVGLYTLKNHSGITAQITNYGGRVVSLYVPDRYGEFEDVVLGYSSIEDYFLSKEKYFGALIGRYGNRISNGKFILEGKEYGLAKNNGKHHLHGGNKGFDSVVWDVIESGSQFLVLRYISNDMEEGYPGKLTVDVKYQLTNSNELKIEYWAKTNKTTIINLTHHSFFNLKGAGNGTINNHLLQINAKYFTPIDSYLIPTGEIQTVKGTPFNFQNPIEIEKALNNMHEQLEYGLGYDHNFVLNLNSTGLSFAAKVVEPISGRVMEVYTNEPGLQFYGGNFLDGTLVGKQGKRYAYRSAFCLETQHFPDSPNNSHFPSTHLKPKEEYYSVCVYKFSTSNK